MKVYGEIEIRLDFVHQLTNDELLEFKQTCEREYLSRCDKTQQSWDLNLNEKRILESGEWRESNGCRYLSTKIAAIQAYRNRTRRGLLEAKNAVEAWMKEHGY